MILVGLLVVLVIGAVAAWLAERWGQNWPRWVSLMTLLAHLIGLLALWAQFSVDADPLDQSTWLLEYSQVWIPQLGINFHLALDGLSLILILLVNVLSILAVAASWQGIQERIGFFHFNLLWIVAALTGVFLAVDLFLFYFFWELMLVPLYFLILIWGHERRVYAAIKLFIFTQAGGLLMLLSILGLYFIHGQNTGVYTFEYQALMHTAFAPAAGFLLMLGFFIAFAVKLPAVPLHTWLPDAHTEAPTAGSVDLAGLVLKVGAYGMIRFLIPLFPEQALSFAPIAMLIGVIGIIYTAVVAFSQTDLKRLIAYTSVSHMGFVLLGIFAWNNLGLQGAIMIMVAHGISTGALFIMVGDLQDRIHTRELGRMGGLWSIMPRMGKSGMVFALASLGLPGLGNFVGEFLVLLGVFQVAPVFAVLASLGFIVASIYSLWMLKKVFFGPNTEDWKLADLNSRETSIMAFMIAGIVWLGLFPQPVLDMAQPALTTLQQYTEQPQSELAVNTIPSEQSQGGQNAS